jgi:catechol 2,3-dioxygenase-like lactoylglutathione lyase family enzyme
MIAHVSIGARDIARARRFYDATLEPLGYACLSSDDASLGYGAKAPGFWIIGATNPVPSHDASGLHICFAAPNRGSVDAFHRAALQAGGKDNGGPGLRAAYGPNYYAAFAIDPDGYRIEAWCGEKS